MKESNAIVVFIEKFDAKYVHRFRRLFPKNKIVVYTEQVETFFEIEQAAEKYKTTKVICIKNFILKRLVKKHDPFVEDKDITLNNYKGSMFHYNNLNVLILSPLQGLIYNYGVTSFLFTRWVKKLTSPNFPRFPKLVYEELTPRNIDVCLEKAKEAILVAVDIETAKPEANMELIDSSHEGLWIYDKRGSGNNKKYIPVIPIITIVIYTCLFRDSQGELYSETYVLRLQEEIDITYMRLFNNVSAPKIMQNGGYDSTYFLRYQAPLYNYLYDTFIAMHAYLVELSRDLAFITSLFDANYVYWKEESETNLVEYGAKDGHNTLWSWIYLAWEMPDWAWENYFNNFRLQFPAMCCGLEGFKIDQKEQKRLLKEREDKVEKNLTHLEKITVTGFNPNSPKQVKALLHGVGFTKAKKTDDTTLQHFKDSHPLWNVLGTLISNIRKDRKAISTYFKATLCAGRLLYELNPGGTDTSRLASKASNLWCGTQIQNIPLYAKSMMVADEGWELNSADNAQSESRCTAYLSQDKNLIAAVEDKEKDFHKVNASNFFGIPYENITPEVRQTGKRVGHGANYNMQERVLLETMGRRAVAKAGKLLGLSGKGLLDICRYLLKCFDKAYPRVRGDWYAELIREVQITGKLTIPGVWTRKCFGDPTQNKHVLNSYVAHKPQCLSVRMINEAFFYAWLRLQLRENVARFKTQVHDDIIWQSRPENTEYTTKVISELMQKPIEINGRTMVIPNDPVTGGRSWKDLKD